MSVRVIRLGTDRSKAAGLRIGTVRRPPRGVRKERIAEDWYDVWLPQLAPSAALVKLGLSATTGKQWNAFVRKYRAEMAKPDNARLVTLLARLSHETNLAVGCFCEDERRCHRSILRALLEEEGADLEQV